MAYLSPPNTIDKRWRMVLIYNIYRLLSIVVISVIFILDENNPANKFLFFTFIGAYSLFGGGCGLFWFYRYPSITPQIFWAGTVDMIVVVLLIHQIGYMTSGLGILLNAFIAILSMLSPGRLGIFFASVASCMLLSLNTVDYLHNPLPQLAIFFSTGVYGAGFFATALTAWYLASWAQSSEQLAYDKSRELDNLQALNSYIVERLQSGVIYVDNDALVKVINQSARSFFNHHRSALPIKLQQLSLSLYRKYRQFLSKCDATEQYGQTMMEEPYLQVHFYAATVNEKTTTLIILEDMKSIAQQAQQLKLASLGRFSASIAHELRNPLGAIAHAAQLLQEYEETDKVEARLRQLILNNCERMNHVIKNVLQITRREQAKPETLFLLPFLKQFKHDFSLLHECKIKTPLAQAKPAAVTFDKSQLEQILIILCENAIHHTHLPPNKVTITLHVEHKNSITILHVYDNGPGVGEDIKAHIFDPFFSTLASGNGMGLFIAKDLCEINKARLDLADSKKGSHFCIIFNSIDEIRV